jgi:hypothetical protein
MQKMRRSTALHRNILRPHFQKITFGSYGFSKAKPTNTIRDRTPKISQDNKIFLGVSIVASGLTMLAAHLNAPYKNGYE